MNLRSIAQLLLLASVCIGTMASAQNLYKWVDESGRVTYSDTPPLGRVKAEEVIRISGSSGSGAARQLADQNTQFNKRQDEIIAKQAESAKKEQQEAVRQDGCTRTRGSLRALRDNVPVARVTENGEKVLLDSEARQAESRRLETIIAESCGNPPS